MRAWQLALVLSAVVVLGLQASPQAAAADVAVTIQGFKFNPETITIPVGTTVTWTNQDSTGHTATSDSGAFGSPLLSQGQSFSFTFTQPGEYTYHCEPHPWMKGKVIVQASTAAPGLTAPAEGARLESFGPALTWTNGPGTTQVHLQVIPANNDGPGVNLVLGSAATSFAIPAPPQWYGLLPDMTYTWRVRTSSAPGPADPAQDQSWTVWAERGFKTPAVTSATVSAVSPVSGGSVSSRTPTLQWSNSRSDVFYYEVQASKDAAFGLNVFLYSELRHGGVTTPPNSYTVPVAFPLDAGATYHWRVRPRVQGDGSAVGWAGPWSFAVSQTATVPTATPTATAAPTRTPMPSPTATPERMDRGGY